MSKKPNPRIEVNPVFVKDWAIVTLVAGRYEAALRDGNGNASWRQNYQARRVAKRWADKLGLPVVEVKG